MAELERTLVRLGHELQFPETPDLAGAVADRLAPAAQRRSPFAALGRPRPAALGRPARVLVLALLAVLLLGGTVFAAVPGARHALLDLLGLRGATVERRPVLRPAPEARGLDLGRRVTLPELRRRVRFRLLVPADPGRPDSAWLRLTTPGGEASLAYRPRRGLPRAAATGLGLLVSEFRGDLDPEYAGKIAAQGTRVERLRVGSYRAVWLAGAPHDFFYRAPGGAFREETLRVAGNVLLLERGRVLVRLEGAMSRRRAIAVARSLR